MKPGFLVIDKPIGPSSHDMVAVIRAVTGIKKVGHTGTLDPFATGVLPIAIGRATRLIQYLDENAKVYEATIQFGQQTDTGDHTGTVIGEAACPSLDSAHIQTVLDSFVGNRMQTPPRYSAVKVDGKALYKYARQGKDVTAKARPIRIDAIELMRCGQDPDRNLDQTLQHNIEVRIHCGRGTYARVLGEEIAEALGTLGHLTQLRRTRSGPFLEAQALSLETLSMMVGGRDDWRRVLRPKKGEEKLPREDRDTVRERLSALMVSPLDALSHMPRQQLAPAQVAQLRRSGMVPPPPTSLADDAKYLAIAEDDLVAVLHRKGGGGRIARMMQVD